MLPIQKLKSPSISHDKRNAMIDESDVSIPYGRDIDHPGVELSINALGLAHSKCEFVCPQCGEQLIKKDHGQIRRHHFAHHVLTTDRNCAWRTDEGVRQAYTQSQRRSIESAHTICLFVQRRPFSPEWALFGSIPPLSSEDVSKVSREKLDGALHIESIGTKNKLEVRDLLPSGGSGGLIELDSTAARYWVDIQPTSIANGGIWEARGICEGDVFVGEENWGRLVFSPRRISSDQYLYYVVPPGGGPTIPSSERFRLGRFEVVRLPADPSHLSTLRQVIPELEIDFEAIQVDVVSPLTVPPSNLTLGRVQIPKGSVVILSVVPPRNKDRPLEIIPIPFKGEGQVTLPPRGLGVPRFFQLNLPEDASQRILIHWPFESNRDWVLDFIPVDPPPPRPLPEVDPAIGLSISHGFLLSPLSHPEVEIEGKLDERGAALLPKIELIAPAGFTVTLKGEFSGDDCRPVWREEQELADSHTLEARLRDMFSRGCRRLEVSFGSLGRITLVAIRIHEEFVNRMVEVQRLERERVEARERTERAKQEEMDRTRRAVERKAWREEMRRRVEVSVGEQDPSPRHISDAFVIKQFELPKTVSKEDLRILRNLVRRRRKELRKEVVQLHEGMAHE